MQKRLDYLIKSLARLAVHGNCVDLRSATQGTPDPGDVIFFSPRIIDIREEKGLSLLFGKPPVLKLNQWMDLGILVDGAIDRD